MSPLRIIPATLAHSLSEAQPCRAHYRFPGDEIDAVCGMNAGGHSFTEWHTDTTGTRRWHELGGDDYEGMIKPGSGPLERCRFHRDDMGRCSLLVEHAGGHHPDEAWDTGEVRS